VNPLFLGTTERRIFGIHEPAAATDGSPRAAVLCYPWGPEYIYAHRSMRQLAQKLSLSGRHTMRFDYFGTGDSAGEEWETDLAGWESDVMSAIEAVKDIAGVPKVALIGLRVGANIATNVALQSPTEVEALVLWDPIMSGAEYVQSLQATPQARSALASSSQMLRDLRGVDFPLAAATLPSRTLILVTERQTSHEELIHRGTKPVPMEFVETSCPWVESVTTTGALPVKVIQRIDEWLR
jgi:uncharacterized protein